MERYEMADGRVYLLIKIERENKSPKYTVCGIIERPSGDTMWSEYIGSYSECRAYIDTRRKIKMTPKMLEMIHYVHKGAECK